MKFLKIAFDRVWYARQRSIAFAIEDAMKVYDKEIKDLYSQIGRIQKDHRELQEKFYRARTRIGRLEQGTVLVALDGDAIGNYEVIAGCVCKFCFGQLGKTHFYDVSKNKILEMQVGHYCLSCNKMTECQGSLSTINRLPPLK